VTRVDCAELSVCTREEWRTRLPDTDEAVVTQLVQRRSTLVRGADRVEFLAVHDAEHRIVSRADLYLHPAGGGPGSVAQIEDLVTNPAHTGRGYAGAILAEAMRRADRFQAEQVFLVADADDWPQFWYRRLGFIPVGRFHGFVRPGTTSVIPAGIPNIVRRGEGNGCSGVGCRIPGTSVV
jgi:ribosomal protein S18 acetylase RimI-like enzyme